MLLLCVEVVIVSTWKLLTLVRADRIFSDAAFGWVDAIVRAVGAGVGRAAGRAALVGAHGGRPGRRWSCCCCCWASPCVGLLMVVMRALLRQATTLRTDLEGVI